MSALQRMFVPFSMSQEEGIPCSRGSTMFRPGPPPHRGHSPPAESAAMSGPAGAARRRAAKEAAGRRGILWVSVLGVAAGVLASGPGGSGGLRRRASPVRPILADGRRRAPRQRRAAPEILPDLPPGPERRFPASGPLPPREGA